MTAEKVPQNQQRDIFFERFLEQRIGKLNNFIEPPAEDSIPFPIRLLPTFPSTTLHKRDSVTSSG